MQLVTIYRMKTFRLSLILRLKGANGKRFAKDPNVEGDDNKGETARQNFLLETARSIEMGEIRNN